ncbi:hypothetical protein HDE_12133 [Halotydeus destructor]|nr:hypothetical protein HDE_12133 [Halotydeus destructor]
MQVPINGQKGHVRQSRQSEATPEVTTNNFGDYDDSSEPDDTPETESPEATWSTETNAPENEVTKLADEESGSSVLLIAAIILFLIVVTVGYLIYKEMKKQRPASKLLASGQAVSEPPARDELFANLPSVVNVVSGKPTSEDRSDTESVFTTPFIPGVASETPSGDGRCWSRICP